MSDNQGRQDEQRNDQLLLYHLAAKGLRATRIGHGSEHFVPRNFYASADILPLIALALGDCSGASFIDSAICCCAFSGLNVLLAAAVEVPLPVSAVAVEAASVSPLRMARTLSTITASIPSWT